MPHNKQSHTTSYVYSTHGVKLLLRNRFSFGLGLYR